MYLADSDHYCVLCGVVCGVLDHECYDPSIIRSKNDAAWTQQVVVISENHDALTLSKAYVTGIGQSAMRFDSYYVQCGNDANFDTSLMPVKRVISDATQLRYCINVHRWYDKSPFAIPMHAYCWENILPRNIGFNWIKPSGSGNTGLHNIDKDVLYDVLKALYSPKSDIYAADHIDFGHARANQDRNWEAVEGEEWLVMNPIDSIDLEEYYRNLPKLDHHCDQVHDTNNSKRFKKMTGNIFSNLPEELILLLMLYLPLRSLNAFRASTPTIAQIELLPSFWKSLMKQQMPWLYDFPYGEDNVDWRTVYIGLTQLSRPSSRMLHGIANRKRMWKICNQVSKRYIKRKLEREAIQRQSPFKIWSEATSSRMPRLIWPDSPDIQQRNTLLIDELASIGKMKLKFAICLQNGVLKGIKLLTAANSIPLGNLGTFDELASCEDIIIDEGDWPVGFITFSQSHDINNKHSPPERSLCGIKILTLLGKGIVVGKEEGDQRICYVARGQVVIGLSAVWSVDRGISRLGLVESEDLDASSNTSAAVSPYASFAGSEISQHLWKGHLPSPDLLLTNNGNGHWDYSSIPDTAAREVLVFGTSDAEMSSITAFAVDTNLGSFRVDYSNRSSRSIGPRNAAMQVLSIDGKGGERLVGFHSHGKNNLTGMRFFTNKGRQLSLGYIYATELHHHELGGARRLVGICGHWDKSKNAGRLKWVAAALLPHNKGLHRVDKLVDNVQTSRWSDTPLPNAWEIQDSRLPYESDFGQRMTFLDFSRPLQQIEVCLIHERNPHGFPRPLPIVSIILTYENGSVASVGPTEFHPSTDTDDLDGPSWCVPCRESKDSKLVTRSHYHSETWSLKQQRVSCLIVWVDKTKSMIQGIQFVAEDNTRSPLWGKCTRKHPSTIVFGDQDHIDGLYCYAGERLNSIHDLDLDLIIVAFQPLTRKKTSEPQVDDV